MVAIGSSTQVGIALGAFYSGATDGMCPPSHEVDDAAA